MKLLPLFFCLSIFPLIAGRVEAQTPEPDNAGGPDAAPAGATVINSDELRMDQVGHTSVFTGNVVVTGSNFNLKCEEMTVYFTNDSKIDNIVAKGNVIIVQPGRITHCGQAQYLRTEDEFILTDQPVIDGAPTTQK